MKKVVKSFSLAFLFTFISIGIVGTQLFYPLHVAIGLSIYIISFYPLIRKIYLSRKEIQRHEGFKKVSTFVQKEVRVLALIALFGILCIGFLIVRPIGGNLFKELTDGEIQEHVANDLYTAISAMDYLESTGNTLLQSLDGPVQDSNTTKQVEEQFATFLQAVILSESLTDTHRFFRYIPYRLTNEREASFVIAYSLYVKKYEIVHRLFTAVSRDEYFKKVLNQHVKSIGRNDIFDEMVARYYAPKTRLRINMGRLYARMFIGDSTGRYQSMVSLLTGKAHESYSYLFTHFDTTIVKTGEVAVDATTNKMFDLWFPLQRSVANAMGHTILSTRGKAYFITDEQIVEMEKTMRPGDIMLQRRNWHLSNVGIPGFWTHSALYTGTVDDLDVYFASEFPFEGFDTFSSYIAGRFPELFATYTMPAKDGYPIAVIEAIEPGVVLQSLEESAHADFVAVLRPSIDRHDVFLSLIRAFEHYGKPYDYNFDFDTRDALVCSELIYDAYYEVPGEKEGLQFETSVVNGRRIVTPLDMAKKYRTEYGTPEPTFDFVYFLKGNETLGTADISTKEDFLDSPTWDKFSFMQDE